MERRKRERKRSSSRKGMGKKRGKTEVYSRWPVDAWALGMNFSGK